MQQEEARQAELVDELELLLEPGARLAAEPMGVRIAIFERAVADLGQLDDGRLRTVREVRVAIAELLGQVESEPLGELDSARDRTAVVGEALHHLDGGAQDALLVSAPLGLATVEGSAVADGDEDVLQRRSARMVRVDVAGGDRRNAERLSELAQDRVPACVAALVRPLKLDEEAIAAEGTGQTRGRIWIANGEPVPRAAGEANEPFVQLLE